MQGTSTSDRQLLDASAFCRQLVGDDTVAAFLADHRKELFADEEFADLFPTGKGRPSIPVDVICSVMVLQALEGLSDRDAVHQLRNRIDWKVSCGLPLDHEGFDPSVLTYWRARLRRSERPERVFDAVRRVIDETGVIAGKSRRALDSTLLDDAVATQDTVTQLIAQIRRVRRQIPALRTVPVTAHDYDRPGKPVVAWNDPLAKNELISGLVNGALALLGAGETLELGAEDAEALGLLALVAGQDVEPGETEGSWTIATRTAKDRVISVVDPQSRHMHKSVSSYRDGYKAHVAVEPESGIITAAELTPANAPDGPVARHLIGSEVHSVLVLADSAYSGGATRAALRKAGHRLAIKPKPLINQRPGFGRDDIVVDELAQTVTCPAGNVAVIPPSRKVGFGRYCVTCPSRPECTTSAQGRQLDLTIDDAELVTARRQWREGVLVEEYRTYRPMVERGIAWLVSNGNRRLRYRGVERNDQWLKTRVAALNLRHLVRLGLTYDNGFVLSTAQ